MTQKALVAKQVADTSKLHVASFVQKTHLRDAEKKAAMDLYQKPYQQGIKRTVGFCIELKHELEDLEETWDFAKGENLDSEGEEEDATPGLKEAKEMTYEDLDKVNHAIKSHTFCLQEMKRKVEHELYMAESAAIAGWGAVGVLENKTYENVSGANPAEKELKTMKIRKASETYAKEQKLFMRAGSSSAYNNAYKPSKRPKYNPGAGKRFSAGPSQPRKDGGYGYGYGHGPATGAIALGWQGDGGASYGDGRGGGYGGGKGRGGYGGNRGSLKVTRTCHRLVKLLKCLVVDACAHDRDSWLT